jgi:hypothetical protein
MPMDNLSTLSTGKVTALISFVGGTGIMALFYLTNSDAIAIAGIGYAVVMGFINLFVLGHLVYHYFKEKVNRKKILKTSAIMLLNIPILLGYCWFALFLFDTIRVTLRNVSNTQLNNITISGCEDKFASELGPGQSKTFWIHIPHGCGISVDYYLSGQSVRDDISGYIPKGRGRIINFDIGIRHESTDANP